MTFRNLIKNSDLATRRAFVGGLAGSLLGASVTSAFGPRAIAQSLNNPLAGDLARGALPRLPGGGRAKSVIYLFLRGGMTHLDTFDPKPGKVTQGPVEALRTRADGVLVGQYFPKLAQQMDKVCVVNSMTSRQGAHEQAQYVMRTSYELRGTIQHPSLGAWCNVEKGRINPTLPGHVLVGGGSDMPTAGFFPPEFQALPIGSADDGLQNAMLPKGVDEKRFQRRLDQLEKLNSAFGEKHQSRDVAAYSKAYNEAIKLMRSSDLTAFDLDLESAAMKQTYGDTPFGSGCLLARRLVEHGVRYVEVMSNGWDTHSENFDRLDDLCPSIDQGLAALLADLDGRGLLEETLVVLATEFGRSPDIDGDNGRNHYPKAFSCLLAGGGIAGGQRFGKTDAEGREVVEDPVSIQDFNATIAYACGLPLDKVVTSPSGRPFKVADKGDPITSIFA
ncbi:MAG: DUF1501 domain-containing protein [Planctomycetes bacterium]|nr:DUF1501 domain-containing protein [Planctomycetota bacterium]MCB9887067.1 DUF1501 domain-containing protein [Planctomycetota bacterium]